MRQFLLPTCWQFGPDKWYLEKKQNSLKRKLEIWAKRERERMRCFRNVSRIAVTWLIWKRDNKRFPEKCQKISWENLNDFKIIAIYQWPKNVVFCSSPDRYLRFLIEWIFCWIEFQSFESIFELNFAKKMILNNLLNWILS